MVGYFVSILLSAVYFLTIPWHPFPGSWVVKAASVAILSMIAVRNRATGLALALAFSAMGDALLEYSPSLFVGGLVAFLLAQITYVVTFVQTWKVARLRPAPVVVIAYSLALAAWLVPGAGSLALPVSIYVLAITAMVVSAFIARFPNRWVEVGAVLFLVSDSVLAVNRFRAPMPLAAWLIWSNYYLAQLLITMGFIQARNLK